MAKTRLAELKLLKEDIVNKEQVDDYSDMAPAQPEAAELSSKSKPAKKRGRPKIGDFLPDEPTEREILEAATNQPSNVSFTLRERNYPIVDLGFLQSKVYLTCLLPQIEDSLKQVSPVIYSIGQFWFFVRNLTPENTELLRQTCLHEETTPAVLEEIFQNWGFPITTSTCEILMEAAKDASVFGAKLSRIFMAPLMESLQSVSIATLILDAVDMLPDLVVASFVGSSVKQGIKPDVEMLKEAIMEDMDVFDMYEVAAAQIEHYKKRGKIKGFINPTNKIVGMGSRVLEMLGQ